MVMQSPDSTRDYSFGFFFYYRTDPPRPAKQARNEARPF